VYVHAAGRQTLDDNSAIADPMQTTVSIMSAGKFLTHIAALQLVERGAIGLDEPVYKHIPELEAFPIISRRAASEAGDYPFTLRPHREKMTLRHLLTHTSGMSDTGEPLIAEYLASDAPKPQYPENAHHIIKACSLPLLFEPGQGFHYGESIHFTQLLVEVVGGMRFTDFMKQNVFEPLNMTSSTYRPKDEPDIWRHRLQMVEKNEEGVLVACDEMTQGLTCSSQDLAALFTDMMSGKSKLLRSEYVDMLFEAQLAPGSAALARFRGNTENYGFIAGKSDTPPAVNFTMAGNMLVENEKLPRSELPRGTVTWEGFPNVMWSMNRKKGLTAFFATQLIPIHDKANELAVTFMRDAWKTFG